MNDRASLQERYEELSTLGRGGSGTVFLVRDRETGDRLALKRLLRADEESLMRLKREFRTLAGLSHPNLIKLYDLRQDATSAFFTMEYLEGEDLQQHLGTPLPAAANDNAQSALERERVARVLATFQQLAAAVHALHAAGILHRDLKPSNVMVSNGRVVVLDFGIALDVASDAATLAQDRLGSGTPAYMAPEQVLGSHIGEANDWYAFGVMLYEALSGSLPVDGKVPLLLQRKITYDPVPIEKLVPSLPDGVANLIMSLLRRAPEERPRGEDVLNVLCAHTGNAADSGVSLSPSRGDAELSLFGRDRELAALWAAFRSMQAGATAAVHVLGESGSGKSALLNHFTEALERASSGADEPQPLVLRSRCYERETFPFKALDAAIDALVHHLSRESDLVVSHAMPSNLLALAQLFPALRSLNAARQLLHREKKLPAGMSQVRAQAEAALSEMLSRLGQQRALVLWFDDLQWADLDSIGIITSWLTPPHSSSLMLVFSYRSEEVSTSPSLRMLRQSVDERSGIETQIALKPLGDEHLRALCTQRFERAHWPAPALTRVVERIVVEAEGSPFLASQLATLAIAQPTQQVARLTLQELVRNRSQSLSDGARALLDVLSVAGRPITPALALRAASVVREAHACVHELQSLYLIRTRDSAAGQLIEVYHDRLREVVQSLLSAEQRGAIDRRLYVSLREAGSTDCDWLHVLALATDERTDALHYGLQAAARASEKLAFERAAELYERCVKLAPDPSANDGELWHKLALAYSYAGHGSKAANTYLLAAQQVSADQRLRFERAAASQLICSGRYDEGETLLVSVLERLGLRAPRSEVGLYAALAYERARLALRGDSYKPRSRDALPFLALFTTELFGMLSMETVAYAPLRAALFQARCQRMALDLGEPEYVARSLCAAAAIVSVEASERAQLRADELIRKAEAIAGQIDSAVLRTNIASARAICAYLARRLDQSVELCAQAEYLLRTASADSEYYQRFSLAAARIATLLELSHCQRAEAELQVYLREAAATENLNAELQICLVHGWVDANRDRAHVAIARLERQRQQLPRVGFGILHVLHMAAVLRTGCATGEYDWALDMTREHWPAFQGSVVKRSEAYSMFAYEAHARLLLCRAARSGHDGKLERTLAPQRRALSKLKFSSAHAVVSRIDARIALAEGDRTRAQRHLAASIDAFDRAGARDQAARDRYALGELEGGELGQERKRAALALLAELGIVAPQRELCGYYPELLDPRRDASD